MIPDAQYEVSSVVVDGVNKGAVRSYSFMNVTADHQISAAFIRSGTDHLINATHDEFTLIQPFGITPYPEGSNATYYTQAKPGSDLISVVVDNNTSPAVSSWTFTNITRDYNISTYGNYTPGQVHVLFSLNQSWGPAPMAVQFTDQSIGGPTSYVWYFGDGSTSTLQNPVHTYPYSGVYSVILRATNDKSGGIGVWNDAITVTDGIIPKPTPTPVPGEINAAFTATPVTGSSPLNVSFQDMSTGNPTSWVWSFGDGGISTLQNPSHQYISTGSYEITLLARNEKYSGSVTKPDYIIVN
jgi:PKD repeat protein